MISALYIALSTVIISQLSMTVIKARRKFKAQSSWYANYILYVNGNGSDEYGLFAV